MNPPGTSGLNQELLNDFFAEADEYLEGIRQNLTQLEASLGKAPLNPNIVESLFRNFHSFKGISAIMDLGPAEAVAHATEDFLRLLRDGKADLTEDRLEILVAATKKLEELVAAFYGRKPLPEHASVLLRLSQLCDQSSASASGKPISATAGEQTGAQVPPSGSSLWKFAFSPSKDLDAGGININSIRQELLKLGRIVKAAPVISGPGKIVFEFFVATDADPGDLTSWQSKGVTVTAVHPSDSPSSTDVSSALGAEALVQNPFLAPSHVIRIDLKRLDELMRITGEMIIHRSRLDVQLAQLNGRSGRDLDLQGVQEASNGLGRSLRELSSAVMRVRLLPVAEIFERMPFVVRDLARQTNKKARLALSGQDTAIDKYLIERLKEPILHLVRNAFSHGVETSTERAASLKPEEATIELSASMAGDSFILKVRDDGRGIDPAAIIRRAEKMGIAIPAVVNPAAILKILCSSGFSTRDDADRASGRGVGMNVVQNTVRELGGELFLESQIGHGTTFTMRLPLTLAIAETFIVKAEEQTYAVPQSFVLAVLQVGEDEVQSVNGVEVISYQSGVLPLVRLARVFQLKSSPRPKLCVLVIASDRGSIGLAIDRVLGRREVVVQALRDPLVQVRGISGATELGDGRPVLILDGAALMGEHVRPPSALEPLPANNLSHS